MIFFYIVVALIVIVLLRSIRIANQYERGVIFRLGRYDRTVGPGLYFMIPLIEWQNKVDLRIATTVVETQEAITRDNVPIKIDTVIWRRTIDPARSVLEVANVGNSVIQVAVTALRNVIGQHTLDEVLKDQVAISAALQQTVDNVTEPWGVKVERVEMKNVEIPPTMQRAMAQEAEALREKRARLIKAEAEMEAASLLQQAAETIMRTPAGLELRRMQMITEVGAEQNSMTIIMVPSEFVDAAKALGAMRKEG